MNEGLLSLNLYIQSQPSVGEARPERRLALVVGNGEYQQMGRLPNPVNDATDIAAALRTLGFQVTILLNATRREMEETLRRFRLEIRSDDVSLFYFAGHGIQIDGQNYLIPVDASIHREADVKYSAVPMNWVLETMQDAGNRVTIIILDACRNNPVTRSWRSGLRGLAVVQATRGSLIAYSTSPGNTAEDGKERNSPYTKALMQYMRQRGITVEQMFKQVRVAVEHVTGGKQTPWELSSLVGDFYFAGR